jgi:hypothetical protein|eukprot:Transcript_23048.p1 GENE.Transcript_23048~~Transcript_23048.p1  ORF type:complete len:327 (-),score=100.68 Transcript_23048:179-1159(-)
MPQPNPSLTLTQLSGHRAVGAPVATEGSVGAASATYDTDASFEADTISDLEEPSGAYSGAGTLTEMSNCSGLQPELSGYSHATGGSGASASPEAVTIDMSGGPSESPGPSSPDVLPAYQPPRFAGGSKPESVLLPPRLAQLATKSGDARMNMALGGVGRQIERNKQHRYATWMVSFEERIRADVAMAFASHDYNGSGAVDEQRLKAVGAEVLPKIDKLLRDAPDFGKNWGFEVKYDPARTHAELLKVQKDLTLGHATAVGPDAPSRWTLDQVTMMVLHWLKQRMDAANKQGKTAHKREWNLRNIVIAVVIFIIIGVAVAVATSTSR